MMEENETLGLRNNNPGNIRFTGIHWQGLQGKNKGFCVFDTIENGTRALAVLLRVNITIEAFNTIRQLIFRYAPPSDRNDTEAYVQDLCEETGLGENDRIPIDATVIRNLMAGIVKHENGSDGWLFFANQRGGLTTIDNAIVAGGWKFP